MVKWLGCSSWGMGEGGAEETGRTEAGLALLSVMATRYALQRLQAAVKPRLSRGASDFDSLCHKCQQ